VDHDASARQHDVGVGASKRDNELRGSGSSVRRGGLVKGSGVVVGKAPHEVLLASLEMRDASVQERGGGRLLMIWLTMGSGSVAARLRHERAPIDEVRHRWSC
jgi:hypothetical protein